MMTGKYKYPLGVEVMGYNIKSYLIKEISTTSVLAT